MHGSDASGPQAAGALSVGSSCRGRNDRSTGSRKELEPSSDLREKICLLGQYSFQECEWEPFREWLESPVVPEPHAIAWIMPVVSCALALLVLVPWLAPVNAGLWTRVAPYLFWLVLVQGGLALWLRRTARPLVDRARGISGELTLLRSGLSLLEGQSFDSSKLRRLAGRVQGAAATVRQLDRLIQAMDQCNKEWFYALSRALLVDTQLALAIERWKIRHKRDLEIWLDAWAEFEALNALACYAHEHREDVFPEMLDGAAEFEASGLGHPLLPQSACVRNDVHLDSERRFYLVSGSNMAGKSTFLRTLGINAVLGSAGAPVRARRARQSSFAVCASVSIVDSLAEGKSKFMAEVERLRETFDGRFRAEARAVRDRRDSERNQFARPQSCGGVVCSSADWRGRDRRTIHSRPRISRNRRGPGSGRIERPHGEPRSVRSVRIRLHPEARRQHAIERTGHCPYGGRGSRKDNSMNLRYAIRVLLKSPGFSLVAVITLALGIGVNTAMFTLVNSVLLRPLPYRDPGRLAAIDQVYSTDGREAFRAWSYPRFENFRRLSSSFESMAAFAAVNVNLTGSGDPEQVKAECVSAGYFHVLGADAASGRTFSDDEDRAPQAVVVISDKLSRSVTGQTIRVNEIPFTVIGVMPREFRGVTGDADIWVPMAMAPAVYDNPRRLTNARSYWHQVIGRLRDGVSFEQAGAVSRALDPEIQKAQPAPGRMQAGTQIGSLLEAKIDPALRRSLLVLSGAVGFVLLVACASLATLLLGRSVARQRETAIRIALGATRGRLVRQFLTEERGAGVGGRGRRVGHRALGRGSGSIAQTRPGARILVQLRESRGSRRGASWTCGWSASRWGFPC